MGNARLPEIDDCANGARGERLKAAAADLLSLCHDMITDCDATWIDIDEWSPEWREFHARYLALVERIEGLPSPAPLS